MRVKSPTGQPSYQNAGMDDDETGPTSDYPPKTPGDPTQRGGPKNFNNRTQTKRSSAPLKRDRRGDTAQVFTELQTLLQSIRDSKKAMK